MYVNFILIMCINKLYNYILIKILIIRGIMMFFVFFYYIFDSVGKIDLLFCDCSFEVYIR